MFKFKSIKKSLLILIFIGSLGNRIYSETVTVAVFDGAKPLIFSEEKGVASGFFPSIMEELLPDKDIKYITNLSFNEAYEKVQRGDIDILPSIIKTTERVKKFDFNNEVVLISWSGLFTTSENNIENILELRDRKVALMRGGQNGNNFIQLMKEFDIPFQPLYFDNFTQMADEVINETVAGMVAFSSFARSEKRVTATDIIFSPAQLYFATKKGTNGELLKELDTRLTTIKQNSNSIYYQELSNWLMYETIEKYPSWLKPAVIYAAFLFLTIMIYLYLQNLHIRKVNRIYKQQKIDLENSEHMSSLFIHNTHDLVWAVNNNLEFTFLNKQCDKFFNIRNKEWIGASLSDFVYNNHCSDLYIALSNAVSGKKYEKDIQISNKDKRTLYVSITPIIEENNTVGAVCFAKDITEKIKFEKGINHKHKLEALGNLTSCIAHDFKNLLNPVIGLAEHLLTTNPEPKESKEGLSIILKASLKANRLIKNLLNFSKHDNMEYKPILLNKVLREFNTILEKSISSNTTLSLELCCEELWVMADKGQIEQVILNLVLNARDAIYNQGSIVIRTFLTDDISSHLKRTYKLQGEYFAIEVKDSGAGIPPHVLGSIFKPHFTTKGDRGSGMGLSSSYGIIKQHKGYLIADSEIDKGSVFTIFLPLISSNKFTNKDEREVLLSGCS